MAKIPFKVSARAGKLLGRENFSNPEGAIIELIKNSYDADAKICFVFFDIPVETRKDDKGKVIIDDDGKPTKFPIKEKSTIYIIDNGEGMTYSVIKDHWMKIGTGNKEKDEISAENRVKTGAKGIGRFALDRLGYETQMWTNSKITKESGLYWKMDWNQFDNHEKSISQIKADLNKDKFTLKNLINSLGLKNEEFESILDSYKFNNGTFIKITNLKDDWFKEDINAVFKALEALIPPKELEIPFAVYFNHFQESKIYGNVNTAFFNDFDYKLQASYNNEKLNVEIEITRNELDLNIIKKEFSHIFKNSKRPYDLKTLKRQTFKYTKSIDKILKWNFSDFNEKLLKDVGAFKLTFYYLKFSNSKKEGYPYKRVSAAERKSIGSSPKGGE